MKIIDLIKNKKPLDAPPVWIMRQAGRYLPEYRKIRSQIPSFLDLCYNPELASEVTLQPIRRFDLDAAIIFSDILVIPDALGVDVSFAQGEGPKLSSFELSDLKIDNVIPFLEPVFENLRLTRQNLARDKALIGFSGAPFTLACYMIEGGGSKNFDLTRRTAIEKPEFFAKLIDILTEAVSTYLIEQVRSGADLVKVFDSWGGILPPAQFQKWVIEPAKKILTDVKKEFPALPMIFFPRGAGASYSEFLNQVPEVDVLALDQNVPLGYVTKELLPKGVILQGNLDNQVLAYGSRDQIKSETQKVLETFAGRPFIFNLGHGIIKDTPINNVEYLIELIRGGRAI